MPITSIKAEPLPTATDGDRLLPLVPVSPGPRSPANRDRRLIMRTLARGAIYEDIQRDNPADSLPLFSRKRQSGKLLSPTYRRFVPMDAPVRHNSLDIRQTDFVSGTAPRIGYIRDKVYSMKVDRQEVLKKTLRRRFLDLNPYETLASFDKDGGGSLSSNELRLGMVLLGMELLLDECLHLYDCTPKNNNGEVGLRELEKVFVGAWSAPGMANVVDAHERTIQRAKARNMERKQRKQAAKDE